MNRNERNTITRLFRATHANRVKNVLPSEWRTSVMTEISQLGRAYGMKTELERLAPRFTLAAASLSIIILLVATTSLGSLPKELAEAYTAQAFDMTSLSWTSM